MEPPPVPTLLPRIENFDPKAWCATVRSTKHDEFLKRALSEG
jgi:hypothetical protein